MGMQVVFLGSWGLTPVVSLPAMSLSPTPSRPTALDSSGFCRPQGPKYYLVAIRFLPSKVVREGSGRRAICTGHSAHHRPCASDSWDSHSHNPNSSAAQKSGLIFLRTSFMGMNSRLAKFGRKDGCLLCTV